MTRPVSHGPTRARRPAGGDLSFVPLDVPRQITVITVRLEQLEGGILRVSMPDAPGWVHAGKTPLELARIVHAAFRESMVVAHARWRGSAYDHPAEPQHRRVRKPRSRGKKRCDVYSADQWMIDERGMWVSPGSGYRFRPDSQVVARVKRARQAMGLAPEPGAEDSRVRLEAITGTQLALRLDDEDAA